MESYSLKQFCTSNGVTGISPVRTNTNGYPFLTLLSPKFEGGATNIYFSKNEAAKVSEGTKANELGLANMNIVISANKEGEERMKLTTTDYCAVEDLF